MEFVPECFYFSHQCYDYLQQFYGLHDYLYNKMQSMLCCSCVVVIVIRFRVCIFTHFFLFMHLVGLCKNYYRSLIWPSSVGDFGNISPKIPSAQNLSYVLIGLTIFIVFLIIEFARFVRWQGERRWGNSIIISLQLVALIYRFQCIGGGIPE